MKQVFTIAVVCFLISGCTNKPVPGSVTSKPLPRNVTPPLSLLRNHYAGTPGLSYPDSALARLRAYFSPRGFYVWPTTQTLHFIGNDTVQRVELSDYYKKQRIDSLQKLAYRLVYGDITHPNKIGIMTVSTLNFRFQFSYDGMGSPSTYNIEYPVQNTDTLFSAIRAF